MVALTGVELSLLTAVVEFIIIFLVNRYFQVVMLITKTVFVDKSTVETSSYIILLF